MRKNRLAETQIIGMIKGEEAGMPTAKVCRRHGLSIATLYKLKAKYGGMEVLEAARLKALAGSARPCEFHFDCIGLRGQGTSLTLQFHQFISEGFGRCPVAQTFARRRVQAVANRPYISIWERQQSRVPR